MSKNEKRLWYGARQWKKSVWISDISWKKKTFHLEASLSNAKLDTLRLAIWLMGKDKILILDILSESANTFNIEDISEILSLVEAEEEKQEWIFFKERNLNVRGFKVNFSYEVRASIVEKDAYIASLAALKSGKLYQTLWRKIDTFVGVYFFSICNLCLCTLFS